MLYGRDMKGRGYLFLFCSSLTWIVPKPGYLRAMCACGLVAVQLATVHAIQFMRIAASKYFATAGKTALQFFPVSSSHYAGARLNHTVRWFSISELNYTYSLQNYNQFPNINNIIF